MTLQEALNILTTYHAWRIGDDEVHMQKPSEVTKAIERAVAKLVVVAADVNPKEIVQHIPILCKEKNIKFAEVDSKQKLGISLGIGVSCSAIAIIDAGEAAKEILALK